MRVLLDTNVLLWWLFDDPRLTRETTELIADVDNTVYVSAVSAFEIATKSSIGKLSVPDDLAELITANAFSELPITVAHGLEVARLPLHHRDPFDRLLIAQARCESLTLLTGDTMLESYEVKVLTVG
ncbi:type II toxin-antitoxin system VapC family toxin [Actinoalloteichus hymeniacidonis]|uniref:PIN domain-containing protein n=1 Tax=Actinoalloteichus hymeniacidonis TaxID=340345 RepID=A0AAC9MY46_9PSEU|nr:type II toxin-antitoxin system VapC family toxin [Actinoalloteichus hymeniacidonis]AOS62612.1 hypothetical protein TL08_08985 [Actinoalloteichus hymeniacidonis]MBB5909356.1 PIN domain nuclease of toxin-antitoxin system [Actinoalloteichus hymeniacidonis]